MKPETLIKKFKLPFSGFEHPIQWTDETGFSLIKDRDSGFASILKIGLSGRKTPSQRIYLWVTISYGRKSDGGISLASGEKGLRDPIDLDFHDEFSYDERDGKFYYREKEVQPHEILSRIEKAHLRPTKKISGAFLRFKLWFWRKFLLSLIKGVDIFLIFLLRLISGEKIEGDALKRLLSEKFSENSTRRGSSVQLEAEQTKFQPGGTISFFGYQAKRRSVIVYCLIHLTLYVVYFYKKTHYSILGGIFGNNFLALCYVIVSFSILDFLIPEFLKKIIKSIPKLYGNISFKRLSIRI